MTDKRAHMSLAVPLQLKRRIEQAAKESGRSISSEVVRRLELSFAQELALTEQHLPLQVPEPVWSPPEGYRLVYQGGHHNVYCNGQRHIRTTGGSTQLSPIEPRAERDCDCAAWQRAKRGPWPHQQPVPDAQGVDVLTILREWPDPRRGAKT